MQVCLVFVVFVFRQGIFIFVYTSLLYFVIYACNGALTYIISSLEG